MKHERLSIVKATHRMTGTRIYRIWQIMKGRCNRPSHTGYKNYGGRGITYDKRWEKFEPFYEDMGESYLKHVAEFGEKNTSIDRVDVDSLYCKENCKWSTIDEQANNKTDSKFITHEGKTKTLKQWSNALNISYTAMSNRLLRGWSIKKTLTTPAKKAKELEYNSEVHTIKEWAKITGLTDAAIRNRVNDMGWSIEDALTTPMQERKNN